MALLSLLNKHSMSYDSIEEAFSKQIKVISTPIQTFTYL